MNRVNRAGNNSIIKSVCIFVVTTLFLSACASGPQINSHYDQSADFTSYKTFGYAEKLGTDSAEYTTLLTQYFKDATRHEMEARGYTYSASNPDLLINFYTNIREEMEVRSTPSPTVGVGLGYGGYYGYRGGMYSTWPLYGNEVSTDNYSVGTANIDVIDRSNNRMVWEGVAEGRLKSDSMSRAESIVSEVTAELFEGYPVPAAM